MEKEIYKLAKIPKHKNITRSIDLGEPKRKIVKFVFNILGLDISGYQHCVDLYGLRHAYNKHSKDKYQLTHKDFKLIPRIIENPDTVTVNNNQKTKTGLSAILYRKVYKSITYYYLEEIQIGKRLLAMKTMYKTKEHL